MDKLFDKNGREIMVGDVLKVYHFTGARKKRHYMYKQVIGIDMFGKTPPIYLRISHLNLDESHNGYYHEAMDNRLLEDYEIIQGFVNGVCFDARPKIKVSDAPQQLGNK